jgi:hypothetical protein
MTNKFSLPYLVARGKYEAEMPTRKWNELSPYEQNRLKSEAGVWIAAIEAVDPLKVRKLTGERYSGV